MSNKKQNKTNFKNNKGFTLLELLVVVIIIAAIAQIATSALLGVDEQARQSINRTEIGEVVKAIRQFRQDTGYYPKQGVFAPLDASGRSPANLEQLFEQPSDAGGDDVLPWDLSAQRGWRGAYLSREFRVDVGDDLLIDGSGDPEFVNVDSYNNLLAVADTYDASPRDGGGGRCEETVDNTACVLDWRRVADDEDADDDDGDEALARHGRPYLYFIDDAAVAVVTGCDSVPCVVGMGANGIYDQGNEDDIVQVVR